MQQVPLYEAKNRLTSLVHEVEQGNSIRLTRHGKAVAVLMGDKDYLSLSEERNCYAASLDRFLLEWPLDETPEPTDPFAEIRSKETGRPVDL